MADKKGGFCGAGFEQSLRIRIGFVANLDWPAKIQIESNRIRYDILTSESAGSVF